MIADYYFVFPSEEAALAALQPFYHQPEDGDPYLVMHSPDYALDIIGHIFEPTGVTLVDADDIPYPEMAHIDCWHVNLRLQGEARRQDAEALAEFIVEPATPYRVWL
jgi:hypothetical protein